MAERCDYCNRPMDRPGTGYCDNSHPKPDLAQSIVAVISRELDDRRGLGWTDLDDELVDEINDRLASLVRGMLPDLATNAEDQHA